MNTPKAGAVVTAAAWLRRWDAQQQVYIADRERCFEVMLSFVAALAPARLTALDLAAGPGSVSARLLRRFPHARCVALDTDPVLLRVGMATLGDAAGRLRWVRADLREPDWPAALDGESFDVVLSTTATHWLRPDQLTAMYARLAALLRPGGFLLNGDRLNPPTTHRRIRAALDAVDRQRQRDAVAAGAEAWREWWDSMRTEESMYDAFAERERIFPAGSRSSDAASPTYAFHEAALYEAGFAEVDTVWQDLDHRVLLALR